MVLGWECMTHLCETGSQIYLVAVLAARARYLTTEAAVDVHLEAALQRHRTDNQAAMDCMSAVLGYDISHAGACHLCGAGSQFPGGSPGPQSQISDSLQGVSIRRGGCGCTS